MDFCQFGNGTVWGAISRVESEGVADVIGDV
jgi:hypothetical protein